MQKENRYDFIILYRFTMLCMLFRSSPTSQKVLKKMIKNDKFNVVSLYKLCVNSNY